MKGQFLILKFGPIGDSDPEVGKWSYEDGVISRGLIKRNLINLALTLDHLEDLPGGNYREFIAESNADAAFFKGAILSGTNVIGGMLARSSRIKKLLNMEMFKMIFKDSRIMLGCSDSNILSNLLKLSGIKYIPWSEIEKSIEKKE